MKKNILLILLLAFTANIYAQYNNQSKKDKEPTEILPSKPNYLDLSEQYDKLSKKYQYGALGCATVSVGLFVGYGCMKDKFACAALAIICQVYSIECKFKANKCLRLQVSENGPGLAYVF